MKKQVSNQLYELIWSMSKNEKRYFQIYASKDIGRKNDISLKLFNLISKNPTIPIIKLEKKITFTKYPSKLKNYLYDFILQTLENYASESNEKIQLRRTLNKVEILFERGLFNQCYRLIKKTEKKALKVEDQVIISELNLWVMRIAKYVHFPKRDKKLQLAIDYRSKALSNLILENNYLIINHQIYESINHSNELKNQRFSLEKLLKNKLLCDKNIPQTFYAKELFNNSWILYYSHINDNKKKSTAIEQNITLTLFNERNELKTYYPYTYFTALSNVSIISLMNKKYEQAEKYFDTLFNIKPKTQQQAVKIFEYYAGNQLSVPLYYGGFEKTLDLILYVEKGLQKYRDKIAPLYQLMIHANACYMLFIMNHFRRSLKFMNYMLNQDNKTIRMDVVRVYRLVNLLIHFELGNIELASYLLDALKLKIKKRDKTYLIEDWFIPFFSELINTPVRDRKSFFIKSEQKLLLLLQNKDEQKLMDNFNFAVWLRSKNDSILFSKAIKLFNAFSWESYIEDRKKW